MKKTYVSPRVIMEVFELSQQASGCTGVVISSTSTICVLSDPDSTVGMLDFATMGGFLDSSVCAVPVPDPSEDALCYHTSSAMAFVS